MLKQDKTPQRKSYCTRLPSTGMASLGTYSLGWWAVPRCTVQYDLLLLAVSTFF